MFTIILTILQINQKFINSKKNNKKNGFTLIELVAVLAIIAILSVSLAPKLSNYITEAKKVNVLNEAKNIVTAFEAYNQRLNTDEDNTEVSDLIGEGKPLEANSIKKIPTDFSITQCRNILDTDSYTFDLDNDGKATDPSVISD